MATQTQRRSASSLGPARSAILGPPPRVTRRASARRPRGLNRKGRVPERTLTRAVTSRTARTARAREDAWQLSVVHVPGRPPPRVNASRGRFRGSTRGHSVVTREVRAIIGRARGARDSPVTLDPLVQPRAAAARSPPLESPAPRDATRRRERGREGERVALELVARAPVIQPDPAAAAGPEGCRGRARGGPLQASRGRRREHTHAPKSTSQHLISHARCTHLSRVRARESKRTHRGRL